MSSIWPTSKLRRRSGQPSRTVGQLVSQGQPGQANTALGQLNKGITVTALGSGQSGNRINKVAVAEVIGLEEQAQTLDAVDIVASLDLLISGQRPTTSNITYTSRGMDR